MLEKGTFTGSGWAMNTAVLFLIFNRPDTTEQVFAAIRDARPGRLYVAADGPRPGREGEPEKCRSARDVVAKVDWKCDVSTLFRDTNLGCREAVSSAISWFFEKEEEGIILEDDCLPHPSFFPFCENMLERYRHDDRVMMVGGTNYLLDELDIEESYCFSRYFAIWGWATWRRAWKRYDIAMAQWPRYKKEGQLNSFYSQRFMRRHVEKMFDAAAAGRIGTWDIQWFYSCLFNNGLSVIPKMNLISNIGLIGTHTSGDTRNNSFPLYALDTSDLRHPAAVYPNSLYDGVFFSRVLKTGVCGIIRKSVFSLLKRVRKVRDQFGSGK